MWNNVKTEWECCQTKLKHCFKITYDVMYSVYVKNNEIIFLRFKSKITIQCFAFKLLLYATMKKAIWTLHYNLISWYRYRNTEDQNTNEKPLNLEEKGEMALVVSRNETFLLITYIMAASTGSGYKVVWRLSGMDSGSYRPQHSLLICSKC